jgi:coenzyme F420-reducing hydrogenase beta subunit
LPSSAYYPAEISAALRTIYEEKDDRRYLIVGLPCVLHSVQQAMARLPRLRRRICFTFALVCGQLPNRFHTEFLAKAAGAPPESPSAVSYRSKANSTRASNFAFVAERSDQAPTRPVWWVGGARRLWMSSYFKHNACNFCDDVFGEVADASFMDAWLPRYMGDPKGHSLVVIRSPEILATYEAMNRDGLVAIEQVPANDVSASQASVVEKKKRLIGGHLHAARQSGRWAPPRRVASSSETWGRHWVTIELARRVMLASKKQWPKVRDAASPNALYKVMWPLEMLLWGQRFMQKGKYFLRSRLSR